MASAGACVCVSHASPHASGPAPQTDIFNQLIETGALPVRPGVKRLISEWPADCGRPRAYSAALRLSGRGRAAAGPSCEPDAPSRRSLLFLAPLSAPGLQLAPRPCADEAIDNGVKVAVCSTSNERAVSNIVKARSGPHCLGSPRCLRTPPAAGRCMLPPLARHYGGVATPVAPPTGAIGGLPLPASCGGSRPAPATASPKSSPLTPPPPPSPAGHAGRPHRLPHARLCGRLRAQEEARPRHLQPGGAGGRQRGWGGGWEGWGGGGGVATCWGASAVCRALCPACLGRRPPARSFNALPTCMLRL